LIRLLTILFIPFYLGVALKCNIQFHYCSGELKAVSFFGSKVNSCCGDDEDNMSSSCCHDDSFVMDSDQHDFHEVHLSFELTDIDDFIPAFHPLKVVKGTSLPKNNFSFLTYEDPPPILKVPLYVKNCTYLI